MTWSNRSAFVAAVSAGLYLSVLALRLLSCSAASAQQQSFDRETYHRAVDYCLGDVSRPIAISADRSVLCLDGLIPKDVDVSQATGLREGGLFVVQSLGGDIAPAIALSNLRRDRHAIVLVHGYCVSACANYLVIVSDQTYVLKGALVAWDYESSDPGFPACTELKMLKIRDGGFKLGRGSCRPASGDQAGYRAVLSAQARFCKERMVDPLSEPPPDDLYVRRTVNNLRRDTYAYQHILWTLHPRYYPTLFKTKIFYEGYPEDPAEDDEIVSRLHSQIRVIYYP